jgi:membrane protein implicated in regulation of membrane protease activity
LLVGEGRRWVGVLAIVNGVLGYLDLAFASALGLPPHTNFLLLVVWEVVLGFTWWRKASRVDAARPGLMADHEQMVDGRGVQAVEPTARS